MPRLLFYAFSAAFASSFCQNLLSLFYEAAPIKKQLALLQCIIKGVSTLVELSLGLGESPVISDSSGAEYAPCSAAVQDACARKCLSFALSYFHTA